MNHLKIKKLLRPLVESVLNEGSNIDSESTESITAWANDIKAKTEFIILKLRQGKISKEQLQIQMQGLNRYVQEINTLLKSI